MTNQGIKNIVIVHDGFANASGWEPAYNILKSKGYKVTLLQNPTTTLTDDVNATIAAIERRDGPVLLVGHSWGGTIITEAGAQDLVAALTGGHTLLMTQPEAMVNMQ
nr:alpha/beta hydrolase [uncultured Flavobacterium sp.]